MSLSSAALVSLSALKAYLGLPAAAQAYDSALETLIDAVSAQAERHTGRKLAARAYTWDLDGDGTVNLYVPEWPLNSVSLLQVDGYEVPARPSLAGSGYLIYGDQGLIKIYSWGVFTAGEQNVHLVCNAGLNPVPYDLAQAACEFAAWKLKESGVVNVGKGKLGETQVVMPQGGGTQSFWTSGLIKDVPPQVGRVFDSYARRGAL